MRVHPTRLGSLVLLLSLATAGCGGARPAAPETPAASASLLAALPGGGVAYGRVDLERLRASAHAPRFAEWYRELVTALPGIDPEARDFVDAEELLRTSEEAVFGLYLAGMGEGGKDPAKADGGEGAVALVRGDVDLERMAAWAEASGTKLERRFVSGRALFVSPGFVMADLGARLVGVAIGPPGAPLLRIEAVRQRLESGARDIADAEIASLAELSGLESASIGAVARVPSELIADAIEELAEGLSPADLRAVRGATMRVDIDRDLLFEVWFRTTGEANAQRLARELDDEARRQVENAWVLLFGLDLWIERTETAAEGRDVRSTLRLSEDELRMWLFHVERLAYAAKAFFADGSFLGGLFDGAGGSDALDAAEAPPVEEAPSEDER